VIRRFAFVSFAFVALVELLAPWPEAPDSFSLARALEVSLLSLGALEVDFFTSRTTLKNQIKESLR
jgi:hypothetical protein